MSRGRKRDFWNCRDWWLSKKIFNWLIDDEIKQAECNIRLIWLSLWVLFPSFPHPQHRKKRFTKKQCPTDIYSCHVWKTGRIMRPHTELVFRINILERKKRPCDFLVSWKKILWHDFLKRLFCVNWTPCAAANKTAMMSFPQWRSWQPWGISKQTDKCLVMLIWAPVIVIPIWICLTATCHHNNTKCTTAPISDTVCLFPIEIL